MGRDDGSVFTFDTDSQKEELSAKKLQQLANAREKALLARRKALKDKLETRLSELRHVLGSDMKNATVEKFAEAMMKQERELRSKQNALIDKLQEAMNNFKDELSSLKKVVLRQSNGVSLSHLPGPSKSPVPRFLRMCLEKWSRKVLRPRDSDFYDYSTATVHSGRQPSDQD